MYDVVNRKIHQDDEMMDFLRAKGKEEEYFEGGEQSVKRIVEILRRIRPSLLVNSKILDYGCAHGRIVRQIPKFLKPSTLVGADVWDSGVKFCKEEFGVIPFVISKENTISNLGIKFHIIIAISVFSHLPPESFKFNLAELKNCLESNGLIFFTTNGEYHRKLNKLTLENGYRYGPLGSEPNHTKGRLTGDEYSFMCVQFSFVNQVAKELGLKVYDFIESGGYAKQDMYVVGN